MPAPSQWRREFPRVDSGAISVQEKLLIHSGTSWMRDAQLELLRQRNTQVAVQKNPYLAGFGVLHHLGLQAPLHSHLIASSFLVDS